MKKNKDHRGFVAVVLTLGFGISCVGCGASEGGATPEDVVRTAQQAFADKNYEPFVACVAPDERPMLSMAMLMGADMMVKMPKAFGGAADPEKEKALKDVLAKHGVEAVSLADLPRGEGSREEAMKKLADEKLKDVDHAAFLTDMMSFLDGIDTGGKTGARMKLEGDLKGLEIDGDTATGRVGAKRVSFVRIDGRWYLKMGS